MIFIELEGTLQCYPGGPAKVSRPFTEEFVLDMVKKAKKEGILSGHVIMQIHKELDK